MITELAEVTETIVGMTMATKSNFVASSSRMISVLQIGDIHYPDCIDATPAIDVKSDPINAAQILAPTGYLFEAATRLLLSQTSKEIKALLFVGDLTTAGDIAGYEQVVRKLSENIIPNFFPRAEFTSRVIVVPGNHDVDWPVCLKADRDEKSLLDKFSVFRDLLNTHGLGSFPLATPCSIIIGNPAQVNILGINTCLGCGELRLFPDAVKQEVRKALNKALTKRGSKGGLTKDDIEILTERLDAPLISKDALDAIDEKLFQHDDSVNRTFNVIVGHHNLLPQLTPKVSPFSELMNAGQLREILSKKSAPVIYLHGHIHDDPIEILINQQLKVGGVISISAPMFIEGFNKITFHFDAAERPLGIEISPYRLDKHGNRRRNQPIRIPYNFGPSRYRGLSVLARKILAKASAGTKSDYFADICAMHTDDTPASICQALHELAWREAVDISNSQDPPENWILRF